MTETQTFETLKKQNDLDMTNDLLFKKWIS